MKDYFFPEEQYQRYVIGQFKKDDFVERMLKEYGDIATDSPKLHSFKKIGAWTVIPCPIELVNRASFLDLASWLSQDGEEAFAIALNDEKSYFSRREILNRFGDTVFVEFDDGVVLRWSLPMGFIKDAAFSVVDLADLEHTNMLAPCNCRQFLSFIGADELIPYFFKMEK